ncbi:MAG: hypothetical protein ACI4S9_02845, partial [Christensenellales bacterium]
DYETIETEEDMEIEYDDSKIYLAFSFTEGDNNSYLQFKMPELYDSEYKGEYPFSWTIAPTLWDSNPNIIKYYAMNYSAGDGLCIPEAGVDYVDPAPPANTAADFYALTDEYIGRVGNGCIRTLQHNLIDALSYAENLKNIESLLCGYGIGISNNYNHNTGASDFLFRDIPYFNQYDGRDVYDTFKYIEETGNNFYSISYSGWEHSLEDLMDLMSTLDDRFVVVTQRQLAKLYKERYLAEYTDVTKVNFSPDMSRDEMAYLYKASVYSDFDGNEKIRYASGDNYFIYRIRPDSAVTEAKLNLSIQGDYSVEVSTDYRKWYVLETGKSSDIANISVNIPSFLIGKQIFVRFGDGTPENGGGVQLHNFNFSTNLSEIDSVEINTLRDAAYNTSDGGEPTADGRSGKFVYALNLKSSVNRADLAVGMMSPEQNLTVRISRDNKNFEKVNTVVYGSTAYAQLGGLNDVVYIEFSSDEAIRSVKFASDAEAVGSVNFRPLGNGIDKTYGLSQDQTEISVGSDVAGQYRGIGIEQALVYAFNLKDVETATLTLNILGQYNVAAGTDLANLTTLENVELGDLPDAVRTFDISSLVVSGKKLYLKIEKSMANLSKVSLKLIRITTDKNEEYLNGKIALENAKTALLTPTSGEETAVIDAAHSHDYGVYVDQSGPTRVINSAANGVLVYKFCFTEANSAYWAAMGLDLSEGELTDVSVVALVANSYKLEISGDGVNYDVISDVSDLVVNGTNKGKIRFSAAEYLGENKTFYFRFSRGSSWNGSHEAILYNLRFSFEQAVG